MSAIPASQTSATQILPAYLYWQFSDDEDLQAFVASYNAIAQGYLDWFLGTPLALYTGAGISGALLDWVGTYLYGVPRPVLGSVTSWSVGALNTTPLNALALNGVEQFSSGSAAAVSDDIYKRVLTWWLYSGDGRQTSIDWIKRRVARFLYGVNGFDVVYPPPASVGPWPDVSVALPKGMLGATNSAPVNVLPVNGSEVVFGSVAEFIITAPSTSATAQALSQLVQQGLLPLPFENQFAVAFD